MRIEWSVSSVTNYVYYSEMLIRERIPVGPIDPIQLGSTLDLGAHVMTPEEQGTVLASALSVPSFVDCVTAVLSERLQTWGSTLNEHYPWYLESVWPNHRRKIERAVEGLSSYLDPGKAGHGALLMMAETLETPLSDRITVHLVAERSSALSQGIPPILCIGPFEVERLVDILFHELLHFIVELSPPNGPYARLHQELSKCGLPELAIRDLKHAFVFLHASQVAREQIKALREIRPLYHAIPGIQRRFLCYFDILRKYGFPKSPNWHQELRVMAQELGRAWRT